MTMPVAAVSRLGHREAMALAETEFARVVDLLGQLDSPDWRQRTVCELEALARRRSPC